MKMNKTQSPSFKDSGEEKVQTQPTLTRNTTIMNHVSIPPY